MGTMNKLRENTGVVLWILVISFGVIWVLQDSGAFNTAGSIGPDIIEVDGEAISYEDYNRALNAQIEDYQTRVGESMPPQRLEQTRDLVFDALVENKLREREMERLGIEVTDEELTDLIVGDNPHPLITSYFGDGQGNVDQALLQNFIDDPEATPQLIQIEAYIRAERRRQKLDNLIASTVRVTDEEVIEEYYKRNRKVSADYIFLRYAGLPNDSVDVSEQDLRNFYNEHREDFARKRSYTIQYASVSKSPSASDSAAALASMEQLKRTFAQAENDSLFLAQYGSERTYGDAFFTRGELDQALGELVFDNPEPGKILGPVIVGNLVHLVKIKDVRPAADPAVHARHILVSFEADTDEEKAESLAEARAILERLRGGADFAEVARTESDDPGSAALGGDLGWFGPGRMVEPFENASFGAEIGEVVGPIETQYGYHIIEVLNRSDQEVKIVDFAESLRPSSSTLSSAEDRLEDLKYFTEEGGDFGAEVAQQGFNLQSVTIEAEQTAIPGIGYSGSLSRFLAEAEQGDVSDVLELNNQLIVAYVDEITPAGYRPFDEVRAEVEARAYVEAKREILRQRLSQAYEQQGLEGAANALGVQLRTASNISFNNLEVSGIGRDQAFGGTVLGLSQGETSDVTAGENGVFIVRVTAVNEPAPITETQKTQIRQELLNRRRSQVQREWIASLREKADVRDYRHRFYQ